MLYYLSTILYLTAFYLPLPASMAPYIDVLEFLPRWLVFLPLLFYVFRKLSLNKYLIFGIISVLNLLLIVDFNVGLGTSQAKVATASVIRVGSYNLGGVSNYSLLINWFNRSQLDVLFLQETDSAALTAALESYSLNSHCAAGLCIVSNAPLTFIDALSRRQFGGWGNFAARYEILIAEHTVELVNVHLDTPRHGLNSLRHDQFDGVTAFLRHYKKRETESLMASMLSNTGKANAIVAGDFNLTEQSVLYRTYWQNWQNSFGQAGFGLGFTKSTRLLGARIDHILASEGIIVLSSRIDPGLGGDHQPIVSQIALAADGQTGVF